MDTFYPGYVMRVYYDLEDDSVLADDLKSLQSTTHNLDICDIKELPGMPVTDASRVFAMVWRFFPTLDPQVP